MIGPVGVAHDVGRGLFHGEIDVEQRVFGQLKATPDSSNKIPDPTHIPEDGLDAHFIQEDHACHDRSGDSFERPGRRETGTPDWEIVGLLDTRALREICDGGIESVVKGHKKVKPDDIEDAGHSRVQSGELHVASLCPTPDEHGGERT